MAAAMKVLDILEQTDALERIEANGQRWRTVSSAGERGWPRRAHRYCGRPQWSLLKFRNSEGADDAVLKNLFQQEAVKRGSCY